MLTVLTLFLLIDSDFTKHVGEFVAVVLMAATGGLLISAAQDLLVIFVGLELLSLGLYILTAFAKRSGQERRSAMKYYLFGGMSAAFLLFGFSYLYGLDGSTNLHEIMRALYGTTASSVGAAALCGAGDDRCGAGLQSSCGAVPSVGAGYVRRRARSGGGIYRIGFESGELRAAHRDRIALLARCAMPCRPASLARYEGFSGPWTVMLAVMSLASMVFGNLAALAQNSVRRLLAYSAIAHAGYILLALAYFFDLGDSMDKRFQCANAILYYILTYGLTTIGAFGVVGWSSAPRAAIAWTRSSGCTSAIRCWPRCCWSCFCRSPGSRRWSGSGPSSICLRRFCGAGAGRFRSRSSRLRWR